MIRMIDYLHTPTSLPGETGMFRIISTCVSGGIWLISMAFHMFSRKGICLVTIFIDVYLSRICVIQSVQFDRGEIPSICISVHL